MQVADFWLSLGDQLTVEVEHNAEHAVSGGVRRPEIQRHRLSEKLAGGKMNRSVRQALGQGRIVDCL